MYKGLVNCNNQPIELMPGDIISIRKTDGAVGIGINDALNVPQRKRRAQGGNAAFGYGLNTHASNHLFVASVSKLNPYSWAQILADLLAIAGVIIENSHESDSTIFYKVASVRPRPAPRKKRQPKTKLNFLLQKTPVEQSSRGFRPV